MSTQPFTLPDDREWLTVNDVGRLYNRAPRTIRRWCSDGTLVDVISGCAIYRSPYGGWLIGVPKDN